jgi:exonuclease VII large subunit
MPVEFERVTALLRDVQQRLGRGYSDIAVTGEVASVREPSGGRAARYLDFEVVDVGTRRRSYETLVVGYRLRASEAERLRGAVQEGVIVLLRGRLGLFGGKVRLDAVEVTPTGTSITREEHERTERRCREEWKARPPEPTVFRDVLLFEVAGTTRVDLDRWTTGLVPNIHHVRIPGDDLDGLLAAVHANLERIRTTRPDLVLFARGGSVPDLSAWSAEALCSTVADIQQQGIPVGAAVGHKQHRPLIYAVASVDIDHPANIADHISARNRRVEVAAAAARDVGPRVTSLVAAHRRRLDASRAEADASVQAATRRAASDVRDVAGRQHLLLPVPHQQERVRRQAAAVDGSVDALLRTCAQHVEDRGRTASRALGQQTTQRISSLTLERAGVEARLHVRVTEALAQAERLTARFETFGDATAHLTSVDGGSPDLSPGATVVLETIDRRIRATVRDVQMRAASDTTRHPSDQER